MHFSQPLMLCEVIDDSESNSAFLGKEKKNNHIVVKVLAFCLVSRFIDIDWPVEYNQILLRWYY